MSDMTPDEARDALVELHHRPFRELFDLADRALNTIAHMRVQQNWRLVDTDTNGGAYQVTRHTRQVTQWEEA